MKNSMASIQQHMDMLCKTIGARPTGSAKNREAVDYAFQTLQKCGFHVRKQEFDCIDWQNNGATLTVGGQNIQAEPSEYSLSCDVEAELVCLDTVAALRGADLSGKIAVMHGELCKESLMPKSFTFYNPDEHKEIISLLEDKAPVAIITVCSGREHIIQDGDFNIPCAVIYGDIPINHGSTDLKAKLSIKTDRIPAKSSNVIATYGTRSETFGTGKEKICFSTHIDTKPSTPGALDNASGVSVLLALAESIKGKENPFQIEIVLFNGEDYYSNPGEMAYMGGLTPEYKMAFNVDGIGLKDSATSVSFYECPQEIEARIIECTNQADMIEKIEPWPMGDHMIFAMCGIPTVAITASNIFSLLGSIIHSPNDDLTNVEVATLNNVLSFLQACISKDYK